MKTKKKLALVVFLVLGVSLFNVVLAQEHSSEIDGFIEDSADILGHEELELYQEGEESDGLSEFEESMEYDEHKKKEIFWFTRIVIGEGFILNSGESKAGFFKGVWAIKNFIENDNALESYENSIIKKEEFGFAEIGHGKDHEKFRLKKQVSDREGFAFDLLSKEEIVVGSLIINPKKYDGIVLWYGELDIDSGNNAGVWGVTAVSKTKAIKHKIKRPPAWNIFAFKQRRETKIKERLEERILEKEGIGEFVKEIRKKDFTDIKPEDRKILVKKEVKIRERAKEKERFRERYEEYIKKEEREGLSEHEKKRIDELKIRLKEKEEEIRNSELEEKA